MPRAVFEIFINILQTFLMVGFITLYLGKKYQGIKGILGFCFGLLLCTAEITLINYLVYFDTYEAYLSLSCYFLYALLFLRGDLMQKLWATVVTQASVSMISLVSMIGVCVGLDYELTELLSVYNSTRVITALAVQVITIIVFLLILRFRYTKPMKKRLWLALSLIPWVSVASLSTLVELAIFFPEYIKTILVSMLCIVIANIMTYYFFVMISKGHEARMELQILEQQSENVKKEIESSRAFVEEMRRVRHDIKNQLFTIGQYLEENDTDSAKAYVNRLSGEYLPMRQNLVVTDNVAFDAIVNAKAALCHPEGIDMVVRAKAEAVQRIDDVDAGILFGNLLDNAIEAVKGTKEKRIFLEVDEKPPYISILIRNSIDESVLEKNPALTTSKKNAKLHGVGIKSVRRLVEERRGMIQFFEENNEFCCHILLDKEN